MTVSHKQVSADHRVNALIADRWSPYVFDPRAVPHADLQSLFEAARWAPSSYNEQPWVYIVATQYQPEEFEKLLSCLDEANQAWARFAPVLALGVVSLRFARNGKENRAAVHDLGLASANLVTEATARGLSVHQMIGISPERAREIYAIPEGWEAWTALAIGYAGDLHSPAAALLNRDTAPRRRRPLSEWVFSQRWGVPSPLVLKDDLEA